MSQYPNKMVKGTEYTFVENSFNSCKGCACWPDGFQKNDNLCSVLRPCSGGIWQAVATAKGLQSVREMTELEKAATRVVILWETEASYDSFLMGIKMLKEELGKPR